MRAMEDCIEEFSMKPLGLMLATESMNLVSKSLLVENWEYSEGMLWF